MRTRPMIMLVAAALLSLQLHAWVHADHGLAGGADICAGCQLSQHGGTLQTHAGIIVNPIAGQAWESAPAASARTTATHSPRARGPPAQGIS